ncbi:MAG: hypothetical protein UX89_C0008G0007 [Parcubacteria group bacterium GW2011_GWA2_47_16]|nr:MAG: hypothetical protein UX89_C0008G0007 [Parcubacteria group bacterium GW2011_GWA2_47_16]
MSVNGNEEIVDYCVVTLPEKGSVVNYDTLKQTLLPAYGEAVMLQGKSSVELACAFFAELADKATEIAYREASSREAYVIRSFLSDRYLHPKNVITFTNNSGKKKSAEKKKTHAVSNEQIEIDLRKLWPESDTEVIGDKLEKAVKRFLSAIRASARGSGKIKIVGEIPILPALYALDLCWSFAEELYCNDTKLK